MPPRLLDKLTDELLVIASHAVAAVSAEEPKLSGNAGLRLLAWTVADARGAVRPLEIKQARTAGLRLDRQARTVLGVLMAACERAERDHQDLEGRSPEFAATASADVEQRLQATFEKHHDEVYVGFSELPELLPEADATPAVATAGGGSADADADTDADADALAALAEEPTAAGAAYEVEEFLRGQGLRFPWKLVEEYKQQDHSVPPDLAKALGREAVQVMWHRIGDFRKSFVGERWWSYGLPHFISLLLLDRSLDRKDVEWHEAELARQQEVSRRNEERLEADIEELEQENARLRVALRDAQSRERAAIVRARLP